MQATERVVGLLRRPFPPASQPLPPSTTTATSPSKKPARPRPPPLFHAVVAHLPPCDSSFVKDRLRAKIALERNGGVVLDVEAAREVGAVFTHIVLAELRQIGRGVYEAMVAQGAVAVGYGWVMAAVDIHELPGVGFCAPRQTLFAAEGTRPLLPASTTTTPNNAAGAETVASTASSTTAATTTTTTTTITPPVAAAEFPWAPADLSGSEDDSVDRDHGRVARPEPLARRNTKYLACAQPALHSEAAKNHNKVFTDIFDFMRDAMGARGKEDQWRAGAYKKLTNLIKSFPRPIRSVDDAREMAGNRAKGLLGGHTLQRIGEILETGTLREAEQLRADPMLTAVIAFRGVHGIGPTKAKELAEGGFLTLEDLDAAAERGDPAITPVIAKGLKYRDDFNLRIPAEEVTAMTEKVRAVLARGWPSLTATAVGSYRRGKPDCGDVDILLVRPVSHPEEGTLTSIVEAIERAGLIIDRLANSDRSFAGVARLGEGYPARRLDLKLYSKDEEPYALLYFTGSDHFNRSMRYFIGRRHRGYSLSDKGLFKNVTRLKTGKVKDSGEKVLGLTTEREVCEFIGIKYLEPHERNV